MIWKNISIEPAVASRNGASSYPGGPCTARKAQLRQISSSTARSNHGHSITSMNVRRNGWSVDSRKKEREEYVRPEAPRRSPSSGSD